MRRVFRRLMRLPRTGSQQLRGELLTGSPVYLVVRPGRRSPADDADAQALHEVRRVWTSRAAKRLAALASEPNLRVAFRRIGGRWVGDGVAQPKTGTAAGPRRYARYGTSDC